LLRREGKGIKTRSGILSSHLNIYNIAFLSIQRHRRRSKETPHIIMYESSYTFNDVSLLEEAITHKSWHNENYKEGCAYKHPTSTSKGYDRLEFLGDAVLKAIQAKHVFETYPDWGEGQLSKARSHLENNQQLASWCRHLGLDARIQTGHSIRSGSKAWENLCSQVFEAFVGAVWKDCNYDFNCIFELYQSWDLPVCDQEIISHKNQLQEYVQKLPPPVRAGGRVVADKDGGKMLTYETLEQSGPSHEPFFSVRCAVRKVGRLQLLQSGSIDTSASTSANRGEAVGSHLHSYGTGTTKKRAETESARAMLALLATLDDEDRGGEGEGEVAAGL
jgi:dsRNA-specific ribonuclease